MNAIQDTNDLPRPSRNATARSLFYFVGAALFALASVTVQVAGAAEREGIDATGNYRSEVRACQSGRSHQDRATCMKEARNALADKRRGRLGGDGADFESNASMRCATFEGVDAAACRARVAGLGSTSGSVAGGGLLREVESIVVPEGSSSYGSEARPPPVERAPMQ